MAIASTPYPRERASNEPHLDRVIERELYLTLFMKDDPLMISSRFFRLVVPTMGAVTPANEDEHKARENVGQSYRLSVSSKQLRFGPC